jgi:hypothetical protein
MQLKKQARHGQIRKVSGALAAATCSLLGQPALAADNNNWQVDSALLYYSETDRVSAAEPVIKAKRSFDDESELELKLVLDSLTGASHNGGLVSDDSVQTFTTPSGAGTYRVQPGQVPLDDAFKDTRVQANLQYLRPINRALRWTGGVGFSSEYDFQALTANTGLLWDLNQKNTTLNFSVGFESDTIDPVGGVPEPFTLQSDDIKDGGTEDRTTTDVLFGVTQVMSRRWIMQLNYNISSSSGYHTDPYKVLTLVDGSGAPREAESLGGADIGPGDAQAFEQRPDSRTKHAVYWENRYHLDRDAVAVSYRYMTDDWGITSHTLDLRYRWMLDDGWYLQPHVRLYQQSEADFWYESLTPSDWQAIQAGTIEEASADYRLGKLSDQTLGLKVGRTLDNGREWSARLEVFQQSGDTEAADLDAIITQIGYSFRF